MKPLKRGWKYPSECRSLPAFVLPATERAKSLGFRLLIGNFRLLPKGKDRPKEQFYEYRGLAPPRINFLKAW